MGRGAGGIRRVIDGHRLILKLLTTLKNAGECFVVRPAVS